MKASDLALIVGSLALAGCSAGSSLSTGSLFGSNKEAAAQPVASATPVATSSPTSRAFQVGTVSARAVKCGYNFDAQKLRASFMAAEVGAGAGSADIPRIEQIYDVSFNGVAKATAADPAYCTEARTKEIKTELARHLAGDFTPPVRQKEADSGGIFGDLGGSKDDKDNSPKYVHPSDIP